jgi:hypothetical protein
MKLFFLLFCLLLAACSPKKGVYWCGDHPCLNTKEKEAYFKKTMIVEIKNIDKKSFNKKSESQKIIELAKLNEKERIKDEKELLKQAKLDEKQRIKNEKELLKQAKLDEKQRIKNEKELEKKIKEDESQVKKSKVNSKTKKLSKKNKLKVENKSSLIKSTKFDDLHYMITKKNSNRGYPDINKTPE